jgi:hypothetical protein
MAITIQLDFSTKKWNEFKKNSYGIALDGYVSGPPKFSLEKNGPVQNFNHHEGVDRLGTRSTSAQVLMAIRMGLFETFTLNKQHHANLFINDCDQDVCLSTWILKNAWMSEQVINPRLNKLVHLSDMMDTTAGCYPMNMGSNLENYAWVFDPYDRFRWSGALSKKNRTDYLSVIEDVHQRISTYVFGNPGSIIVDTSYDILNKKGLWSVIVEKGNYSRIQLSADGIYAYISVREKDGRYDYSIGKLSEYIPVDIEHCYFMLNRAEGIEDFNYGWGGSTIIGGSPRKTGSKLKPNEVLDIITQ